jgi:AraC-like DNA-binding protein
MRLAIQQHIFKSRLYIERNLSEHLDGECIAEQAFLSYFHFQHQFKAYTGESVWQYVKRLRLEKAAFLLLFTSLPVTDIAYQTGFKTTSALSKAFRSWYGLSPQKYRQQHEKLTLNSSTLHFDWNDVKEIRKPDKKVISFRSEGIKQFPQGYFEWMRIAGPLCENKITLIGRSPDQPHITPFSKLQWDTAIPVESLPEAVKQNLLQNQLFFEDILPGGNYLVLPFTGFGSPYVKDISTILTFLHKQGLEWRPSGNSFQIMRQHASDSQCLTDLFIPIV